MGLIRANDTNRSLPRFVLFITLLLPLFNRTKGQAFAPRVVIDSPLSIMMTSGHVGSRGFQEESRRGPILSLENFVKGERSEEEEEEEDRRRRFSV